MANGTTKKSTRKKAPSKKKPRKRKTNGEGQKPPVDLKLEEGTLKYKLKAAALQFKQENARVSALAQPKIQEVLAAAQQSDKEWLKAFTEQQETIDEVILELQGALPPDYMVSNVNFADGIVTAVYNPDGAKEQRKQISKKK